MKNVSVITLGCAKNDNDTDNLKGLLKKEGHTLQPDLSKADAVVVHTCSFIESAKKESVKTILDAAKTKSKKAKLYVTGCMVQQHGPEMLQELPEVDGFLGTGQLKQIPLVLKQEPTQRFLDRRDPGGLTDPDAERLLSLEGPTATLRLSEGCSHPCSFCVIPKLRGSLQSRPKETILKEAKALAKKGIQELVLIGQDTGDWGRDLYGHRPLASLMRSLREIQGLKWVRLMYMHPQSFTDELIGVFAESPDLFPYLDMPLQHIDGSLLQDMKRILPEKAVRDLLDKIHQKMPHTALRTTFIVGYPGETEQQFNTLNSLINEGHFDHVGAFPYSKEENTPAAIKKNQIPDNIKQERHQALMATTFSVAHQKAQKRMGRVETILVEAQEGKSFVGRSRREAPEIDAVFRLSSHPSNQKPKPGQFIPAKITGYEAFEFTAETIKKPKN